MIFAASIADPPPTAMMTSGLNPAISFAPSLAQASVGSGATFENVVNMMPWFSSERSIALVYPFA